MTKIDTTRKRTLRVAVDVAKSHNEVLIESAGLPPCRYPNDRLVFAG
jgi:hypothetical protein